MAFYQSMLVLLVGMSVAVSALNCYICSGGAPGAPCSDPIIATDSSVYQGTCFGAKSYCMKIGHAYPDNWPSPIENIIRQCTTPGDGFQPNHCYRRNLLATHGLITTICVCDTDLCNGVASFSYPVIELTA